MGRVTIATDDDEVIGLAHLGDLDGVPVLWKIYVHPARRSTGVGAALVEHLVVALPAGTEQLLVEHIAANVDAARFLRRHGFARTHAEPHDDHRLATVWRRRRLTPGPGTGHRNHAGSHDEMAAWLDLAPGSRIADIGSGAGGFAASLSASVGPHGHLTLIDTDAALLALAQRRQPDGVTVATLHLDLDRADLPTELDGTFDLVHAGAVVHHTYDQRRTIEGLARLVAPGGRLVIGEGGLPARHLPTECGLGEPGLETRLHAATIDWFWSTVRPAWATVAADTGWDELLNDAGLEQTHSRSFLLDVPAPLDVAYRRLVADILAATADRLGSRLEPDVRSAIAALVDPARFDSVHQRPDVFVLAARTLHVATRPLTST
ncbi:MAG: GNAT family N-acetyltransferase [Ilumatobacteraceae bacterium]